MAIVSLVRKPLNKVCMSLPKYVLKRFIIAMVSLQDFSEVGLHIQNLDYDLWRHKSLQMIKYVLKDINQWTPEEYSCWLWKIYISHLSLWA